MVNENLGRAGLADLRRTLFGPDFPPPADRRVPRRLARFWERWRSVVIPLLVFGVIGLAFAAARYLDENRQMPGNAPILIAFLTSLPVLLAYARPLWAWRIGFVALFIGAMYASPTEAWPWNPVQIVFFLIILLALALRADSGVVAWAGVLTLAPVFVYVESANAFGVAVLFLAILLVGDQIRRRRQSQTRLVEQEEVSELEKARRAVLEERTRIAREMHDVVAHHMSMIAVQAETAPYRLTGLDEPVRAEFASIAGSAREAMTDMRRLLGVLRSETAPALTAPQPGLADIGGLVEAAKRAGVDVTVVALPDAADAAGDTADGPVGLAAYRIVQEALANAARHAPGAPVWVRVTSDGGAVRTRIDNAAASEPPAPRQPGGPAEIEAAPAADHPEVPGPGDSTGDGSGDGSGDGHGLAGMRERATLLGGVFTAGPTGDGGFTVAATLPLPTTPPLPTREELTA